jgi:rSAM/selenodomain-associated transferase 2
VADAAETTGRLSVIVPALNEAAGITATLQRLQTLRNRGHEVIVVDGASTDATVELAKPLADRVICCTRGRAAQMHTGADAATGSVFWFLHADTLPPVDADRIILPALRVQGREWGRFDVELGGNGLLHLVAWLMNVRSRLSGIATGDQGIFVTRNAYRQVGGFAPIPLMEDIAICRSLKRISRPVTLRNRVHTSNRRWQRHGIVATVLTMWLLRLGYFIGVKPDRLAAFYTAHNA